MRLVFTLALALAAGCGDRDTRVALDPSAAPVQRAKVRAFYSGHSLTDGVPEAMSAFLPSLAAQGKPADFDFEFQSGGGALIRARGIGLESAEPMSGYRWGRNRHGENLDVIAEWRSPHTLKPGDRYNVLVITERHDLPWTIEHEQTLPALAHYVDEFLWASRFVDEAQKEPRYGDVLLYHVWLERNGGPISDWIDYERDALPLWECTASAVNRTMAAGLPQLRVLPGATALASLVEGMVRGEAPGVSGGEAERLKLIFSDNVHLAPVGQYFMSLVHYAALFGVSPEGASAPKGVSPELARYMQQLAWQHVSEYAKRAAAGAGRDVAWCNAYAKDVMCPRYYQYRKPEGGSLVDRARHAWSVLRCGAKPAFTFDRISVSGPRPPME